MAQPLSPAAPDLGVRIIIKPLNNMARWIGTRVQLESEGFIPKDQAWPEASKTTSWKVGDLSFFIHRVKTVQNEVSASGCRYRIDSHFWDGKFKTRMINAKALELVALLKPDRTSWSANDECYLAARKDDEFQEFKRNLLGQKRRGRPAKSNSTTQEVQS